MIAAYLLIAGGILRVGGEIAELLAGTPTPVSALAAAVALVCVAAGFIGLWADARESRLGQAAIVLIIAGALGFTAVAIWSLTQGIVPLAQISTSLPFRTAAILALAGALSLAGWLVASSHYPRWIGIVMSASIIGSILVSFVPHYPVVQPLIDVVMAYTFIQLGLSMLKHHRIRAKQRR